MLHCRPPSPARRRLGSTLVGTTRLRTGLLARREKGVQRAWVRGLRARQLSQVVPQVHTTVPASARTTENVWISWCTAPRRVDRHFAVTQHSFPYSPAQAEPRRQTGQCSAPLNAANTPHTLNCSELDPTPPRAGIRSRRALEWRSGALRLGPRAGTRTPGPARRRDSRCCGVKALVGHAGNRGPTSGCKHSAWHPSRLTQLPQRARLCISCGAAPTPCARRVG